MKILVVGGGGREHALCWALKSDAPSASLFCTPGNPGTAALGENLSVSAGDVTAIRDTAVDLQVDLVVVGPEAPLASGVADVLRRAGIAVFGPDAGAAQIEASKVFAKEIMAAGRVPTGKAEIVTTSDAAAAAIEASAEPLVVKASGLAGGKGAVVCDTRAEALDAATAMLQGRFGSAGEQVLIEEYLEGEELSVFALTDGERALLLPAAQDHKRLLEGDAGPNTGGMGAYSPVSIATPELLDRVYDEVLAPTLHAMRHAGCRYRGVLYAGLMIRDGNDPFVIEFNCRFGDPEAQIVLPLVPGLLDSIQEISAGEDLSRTGSLQAEGAAAVTVLAAAGYPVSPRRGDAISLPSDLPHDVLVFHAGTVRADDGTLRTAGGRVLNVVGLGPDVERAVGLSQEVAARIAFDGAQYRTDIGWRELARARAS